MRIPQCRFTINPKMCMVIYGGIHMKLFVRLFVVVFFSLTLLVPVAHATDDRTPVHVVLEKNETVNKDYFATGDTVRISGTVNGDAYVAGGTVTVDGVINGDLLVAAGTIHISGPIKNDVRALGGMINFTSTVGGNVTLGAGNAVINPEAKIGGSILAGAGTLGIYAPVGKGITAGSGTLTINNSVGGDMLLGVGELTLQPKTKVSGDVTYWAQQEAMVADNVTLSGDMVYHQMPKSDVRKAEISKNGSKAVAMMFTGMAAMMAAAMAIAMFILGLIIMNVLPLFTQRTIQGMQKNPWGSFGLGIVTVILVPIVALMAMATVVGIPVGIFFFMVLGLLGCLGHLYAAFYIGEGMFRWLKADVHRVWHLLVGLCLMGILTMIPFIGWLAKGVLGLIGMGALLFEKQATYKQMRARHLV